MAIGRISGSVLKANLTRNGTDLAFETNLLYLDVTNSRIGINTSSPSALLDVNGTINASSITGLTSLGIAGTGTSALLTLTTTESSNSASPKIDLKRNSSSPADSDNLGQIRFLGENSADEEVAYATITGKTFDVTNGTEDGKIQVQVMKGGSLTNSMRFEPDGIFLNTANTIVFEGPTSDTYETTLTVVDPTADHTVSLPNATGTVAVYASDGNNGQVLTTNGSGTLSFSDSTGGGGGTNTAVKTINYYKLTTSSAVVDQFDLTEYRGAIYDVSIEDVGNSFTGHLKVSVVHDSSTPYIAVYDLNEDSTRIVDFTAAISGNNLQLSAASNTSSNVTLRMQRVALGDHHESVGNTNSKIIKTSTAITSSATELDYFTKTDIQSAKYVILTKDTTQGDYSIQEMSLTHNGTTVFHNTYGIVSSRSVAPVNFTAAISSSTLSLYGASNVGTTATAILYRIDLGSKTKVGTFDNVTYKKIKDIDSAVTTIDDFDVYKYVSAKYFISVANSDNTQYQNSEITLNVNSAKNGATISQSVVSTGTFDLATFTADVSSSKARLRMAGSPANNEVYIARMSIAKELIYYEATGTGATQFSYPPAFSTISNTGTITLPTSSDTLVGRATTDTLTNKTLTSPTINAGTMTGDFDFADNSKILMGDGDDLKIYHSGSHSIIQDAGIGYLRIRGSKIQIMGNGSDEMQIVSTEDGSAELYYNGTKTFETISTGVQTTGTVNINGAYTFPTADGSNTQVLQTDGSGTLSFASAGGGAGTDNQAVKQFNFYKLSTSSAVIDEFDIAAYRGAIYDIEIEDTDQSMIGHVKVSIVHNDSTPYVSVYNVNEDSTRICDFTVAISGQTVQLSAVTNVSTHTNLRCYRIALGDHNEQKDATNTKIIKVSSAIGSAATTLDQFTKTDYQGVKYYILTIDSTASEYQISEMNLVHNGTTCFLNDYAKVSSTSGYSHTYQATISGATVTLAALSSSNTTATALLYRVGLGSKTKLGTYDNVFYNVIGDIDSTVETIDTFDVFKYKSARYSINIGHSGDTEYQHSEIVLTVNSAGSDATISESVVRTGTSDLATFTADVSGGKARLRMQGTSSNTKIYLARLAIESTNIYRASAQTSDNLYITHNNINLIDTALDISGATGSLKLPSGTTAQRSTGAVGMIRYNTSTSSYERYDSSGWTNIATTASTSESDDTTTGAKVSISTSATTIDTFATSAYDSAFYLAVTRDEINDEVATAQISVVHNNSTAFMASGGVIQSGSNDQLTFSADVSGSDVRLRGTGSSDVNSIKFYRIGLGDSTSAATTGNVSTVLNSDVDSAVENLDTWAHASYRGAKYYISANNTSKTELQNIECLVVHNGTTAFITTYNDIYTGNNALITLTADISGSDVRLRATGNEPNTAVKMYRVLLSDSESDASGTNTSVVGAVTVSSSATQVDTFSSDSYTGIHYVVVGYNSGESGTPGSIAEAMVVTDGTDAYVGNSQISTKGTDQLTFSATLSGTTVSFKALSTSGSSTTVNAYRVHILRGAAGASTSLVMLKGNDQTITGTKTFTSAIEADTIRTPGSNANLLLDPQGTGKVSINGVYTLPIADGTSNQVLQTDGDGTVSFGTVTAGAGGSTTQVQYNSSGSLAGSSNLTFDGTTLTANTLTVSNNARITGNLTIDGTTTIVNTSTLSVEDNIIEVNRNVSSNAGMPTVSGLKVNRGEGSTATENDIFWAWDESYADDGTTTYGNAGGAWTAFRSANEEVDALVDIRANVVHAVSTSAQYADLAEKYDNDQTYPIGTVMMVGGEKETTAWSSHNIAIGVISENPAFLMNKEGPGQAHAIRGKVPVRIIGAVQKGQKVYAHQGGVGSIIGLELVGIALETNTNTNEKLINCILKI